MAQLFRKEATRRMAQYAEQANALPDFAQHYLLFQMVWSKEELAAALTPYITADQIKRWLQPPMFSEHFPLVVIVRPDRPNEIEIDGLRDLYNLSFLAQGK